MRILKWLAVLISAILIVAALAGCGGATSLPRPTPSGAATTYEITGSCTVSGSGNTVTVSGTISVMAGANVDVSIVAQNGMIIAHQTITQTNEGTISETFTLTDEMREGVVDIRGYICCAPSLYGKQPESVYTAYGKKFENLANSKQTAIWNNEGIIVTIASDNWLYGIVPSPTNAPTPSPAATPASSDAAATPSA